MPREDCERAVQWVGEDGLRAEGAEAVFLVLAAGGHTAWLAAYRRVPLLAPLAGAAYRFVARWRGVLSVLTRMLWGADARRPTFATGSWLFLRALAIVFLVAFVSLAAQIHGLVGSRGILPAAAFFEAVREAGGGGAWLRVPAVFWATGAGDSMLLAACLLGAIAALAAVLGVLQGPMFVVMWALYLSLCAAGQVFLAFQWDGLLLEAGFLAVFLAPWNLRAGGPSPPPWPARFLVLWLLFRLMFSSGVVKLTSGDAAWWPGLGALSYHFHTQPLPTPPAWWADKLPSGALKAGVLAMFFVELVLPFFLWSPRRPRHAAVLGIVMLQAAIALTGNYGFFNFLTVALCLPALDDRFFSWLRVPPPRPRLLRPPTALTASLAVMVVVLSFVPLAGAFRAHSLVPAFLGRSWEAVAPFRSLNAYGLFAIMTKERREILIEGSDDGLTWQAYEFRFKPGDPRRPPPWAGPHMPRLDWQMWFAALGTPATNPWFTHFCEKLLLAEPAVLRLLAKDPFEGRRPLFIRANADIYSFSSFVEKRTTGKWWETEPRAIYLSDVALDPARRSAPR